MQESAQPPAGAIDTSGESAAGSAADNVGDDRARAREDVPSAEEVQDADLENGQLAPDLPLPMMLEALLMVADEPVTVLLLAELCAAPAQALALELERLAGEYAQQGRGFELRQVAGGWRLYTRSECAGLVERFVLRGQTTRITQAALETLAVVAYRQPVARGRVAAVRGVNVDGVMRTLAARGLIDERGTEPESGAVLYGTTPLFLERLGLRDLSELPALAPLLPDLESFDYDQDSIST